jgi:hypothetical protein
MAVQPFPGGCMLEPQVLLLLDWPARCTWDILQYQAMPGSKEGGDVTVTRAGAGKYSRQLPSNRHACKDCTAVACCSSCNCCIPQKLDLPCSLPNEYT